MVIWGVRSLVVVGVLAACGRVGFSPATGADGPANQIRTPPRFVQTDSTGAGSAAVATRALPANVAAGNMILVAIDVVPGAGITVVVTDDKGQTYTVLGPFDGNDSVRHFIAYTLAQMSGPTTVTSTLSSAPATYHDLRLHEYANTAMTDPVEATASATGITQVMDGVRSGVVTTTEPNELIFGFATYAGQGVPGTGFTLRSNFDFDLTEDRVAVTPGPYEALSTLTNGSTWTIDAVTIRGR